MRNALVILLFLLYSSSTFAAGPIIVETNPDKNACAEALSFSPDFVKNISQAALSLTLELGRLPKKQEVANRMDVARSAVISYFSAQETTDTGIPSLVRRVARENAETMAPLYLIIRKEALRLLRKNHIPPDISALASALEKKPDELRQLLLILFPAQNDKMLITSLLTHNKKPTAEEFAPVTNRIVNVYSTLAKRLGRIPDHDEVASELGLEAEDLENMFVSGLIADSSNAQNIQDMAALKALAKRRKPAAFKNVIGDELLTPQRQAALVKAIKSRKRLIITTAVSGCPVETKFFSSLLLYAEKMDAEVIVIPSNMITNELDPILITTPRIHILTNTTELTDEFVIHNIKIMAKQRRPLTGLSRLGKREQSMIYGSPQQVMRVTATFDNDDGFAHREMTTGAITKPIYDSQRFISERTDLLAAADHRMGAIVLEKTDGSENSLGLPARGNFNSRFIRYIEEIGGFVDTGFLFTSDKVQPIDPEAVVLGDVHVVYDDQRLYKPLVEQIFQLRPRFVVLHDLLNGHSISHHDAQKNVTRAQRLKNGEGSLEEELHRVAAFINALTASDNQIQIVINVSNHDDWLARYLESGRYLTEPHNAAIGAKLAAAFFAGKDPYVEALNWAGIEYPKRVAINRKSFKVGPRNRLVELGQHGHAGANGAKAGMKTFAEGADSSVFGHTHTISVDNDHYNIGCFVFRRPDYASSGASNWRNALAMISPLGTVQPLEFNHLAGHWYNDAGQKVQPSSQFFPENYPRLIPNVKSPTGAGQVDQYGSRKKTRR